MQYIRYFKHYIKYEGSIRVYYFKFYDQIWREEKPKKGCLRNKSIKSINKSYLKLLVAYNTHQTIKNYFKIDYIFFSTLNNAL